MIWQFRLKSIILPKYFIEASFFSTLSLILRVTWWLSFFWGGWNITKLDFSIFRESLLQISQALTVLRWLFMVISRAEALICIKYVWVISKKMKVKNISSVFKVINIQKEKKTTEEQEARAEDRSLWESTCNRFGIWHGTTNWNKLFSITKIWLEPIIDDTTNSIMCKFLEQDSVIDCVKSFT